MKIYELLNHTADLGIRVYGKTLKDLFSNSAYAMFDLIADIEKVESKEKIEIEKSAEDENELLINWLRGLHSYYAVEGYLFKKFRILKLTSQEVAGFAEGEKFDPQKHILKKEIKAVTYHALGIEKEKGLYKTEIIFDV
ncbi:MAG: archease [Candidatus Omnitrophica bacterium]|nr:archease [Candidatus Omnitrophota bacterium]MCM8793133.1 archease [Candidatus Omnitrophota bacterium]